MDQNFNKLLIVDKANNLTAHVEQEINDFNAIYPKKISLDDVIKELQSKRLTTEIKHLQKD